MMYDPDNEPDISAADYDAADLVWTALGNLKPKLQSREVREMVDEFRRELIDYQYGDA